jgi:hypothetical protein
MRFKWKLLLKVSKCNLNVAMPFHCSHHADVAGVGVRRGATKAPPSPRARRSQLRQEIAAQRALDALGQEAEGRSNEREVYILVTLREFESSIQAMYVATTVPYASNGPSECKSHANCLSCCCGCSFCTVRSVAQSGRLCVPKVAAKATVCGLGGLGWRHADPVPMVLSIRRAASSCAKICRRRMLLRGLPFVPPRRERHVIGDPNLCRCTQDGRRVGWCCFAHHVDRQPSCVPICVRYSEEVAESSIGLEGCLHHLQFPWALTFNTSGLARL